MEQSPFFGVLEAKERKFKQNLGDRVGLITENRSGYAGIRVESKINDYGEPEFHVYMTSGSWGHRKPELIAVVTTLLGVPVNTGAQT